MDALLEKAFAKAIEKLAFCEKKIERLTNPQKYGCCLSRCNSIVINKERMMVVTAENGKTSYEFSTTSPTYFTPSTARDIVKNDIFRDGLGNRIELTIVGELEYYQILKDWLTEQVKTIKEIA